MKRLCKKTKISREFARNNLKNSRKIRVISRLIILFFRRAFAVVEKVCAARFPARLAAVFDLFGAQFQFLFLLASPLGAFERRRAAFAPVIFDRHEQQYEHSQTGQNQGQNDDPRKTRH